MKHTFLLLTILLVLTVTFSCRNSNEKRAEKMTERILEKAGGGDVDVDGESVTIKTEDGTMTANTSDKKWPSEIPGEVPEFKFGKVENVIFRDMNDGKIWTMLYENMPEDILAKYKSKLDDKGFETHLVSVDNSGGMLTGEKGELNIAVMAGEGSASVSVSQEK